MSKKLLADGCCIFYGTKDTMVVGSWGQNPFLVSGRKPVVPELCRVVKNNNHQQDWIRACKEDPASRVLTTSDFSKSGPLNEMVVMGVAAVRLQSLGQWLDWDGKNMRFTNIPADATIRNVVEDKFKITDGNPTFDRVYSDPVPAQLYAERLIKPVYRQGWKLPDMPND